MAAMAWNDSYSVGNAVLDSDHRILINLINQLHDAVDTGQSREVVGSVLNVLVEYVEHHFRREEAMLAEADYPSLDRHKAMHKTLEGEVLAIRDRWRGGTREALGDEVLEFLKKWLTDHILVSDKAYCSWVDGTGRGSEGGRA